MEEKSSATLEKIQQAALQEFLDKGFMGASLLQIVKYAGVTTGAMASTSSIALNHKSGSMLLFYSICSIGIYRIIPLNMLLYKYIVV